MHLPSALLLTAATAMVFEPAENDNAPAVQGIREETAAALAAPNKDVDDLVNFQKRQAATQGSGDKKNGGNGKKGLGAKKGKGDKNKKNKKGKKGKKGNKDKKGTKGKGKGGKGDAGNPPKPVANGKQPEVVGSSGSSDIGFVVSEMTTNPTIVGSSFPSEFTINVGTETWIAKKASTPHIAVLSKRSVNQTNEGFVANSFAAVATMFVGGVMLLF